MVTVLTIGAFWLAITAAGALVAGLVRTPLRLEERAAVAAVAGIVLGAVGALLAALATSLTTASVFAGPLSVALLALVGARFAGDPRRPWEQSFAEARERWRSRALWPMAALMVVASIGFSLAFAHALFPGRDGSITAGYSTVWADWSLHATAANSFVAGHNLPPQDPIFSGTPFRYPFVPDFSSSMLLVLGASLRFALEAPDVVLCVAATVLVVSLAHRLAGSFAAGVVAMAVVLLGGGLGFTGLWWDACTAAGYQHAQCSAAHLASHPADTIGVGTVVLRRSISMIADQPRAYDGLLTAARDSPLGSTHQWYTPLLAWWLPQRTFVYGFAMVMAVLLLVETGLQRAPPAWSPFCVGGLLVGILPWMHVHSFFVLLMALPVAALLRRRREWLALGGIGFVLALPRVVQLALGGHGSTTGPYGDDTFPYLQPGWMWNDDPSWSHVHFSFGVIPSLLVQVARVALSPGFWGFWLLNTGVLVPMCMVAVAGVLLWRVPQGWARAAAERVAGVFPRPLLCFCLPLLLVFPVANVVVFQAWNWDNTKLLAYWQLAAALLTGVLVTSWWRARGWRAASATAMLFTILASGGLVMLRLLPWTPQDHSPGVFTWASAEDQRLAQQVEAVTPPRSVFVTAGSPDDPVLTLAGRSAVLGYNGWLFSYGTDFGTRVSDVATILRGCRGSDPCAVYDLLRRYNVAFVRIGYPEIRQQGADAAWWAEHFPAVAQDSDTVVYDVRSA